jgi:type III pantothenate kinase
MLLAIDIGNTNITLGLYDGERRVGAWRLATAHERMPDEYGLQLLGLLRHAGVEPAQLTGGALASVVPPLTGTFLQACALYLNLQPLVVDAGVKTCVLIRYEDPKAVGADRVVDAAAVQQLYGGPACVVDFGTATTFDAISAEGDYLGGAIAPGIGTSAEELFRKAARLPRVELTRPARALGRTTEESLRAGVLWGAAGQVDALVRRLAREMGGSPHVIATGGWAKVVAPECETVEAVDEGLTLKGMKILWEARS